MYAVRLRSSRVRRELEALKQEDRKRIVEHLNKLVEEPRPQGSVKLEDSIYRIRVGDFRIFYLVDDEERRVEVGAVRRRQETTYRRYQEFF